MSKTIITHPDNLKYVENLFNKTEKEEQDDFSSFLHFIRPKPFKILTNVNIEREKWTGKWEVLENKYYSYWDGQDEPPSWVIYFGFARKVMEPLFYQMENRMRFFDPNWSKIAINDNRTIIRNFA